MPTIPKNWRIMPIILQNNPEIANPLPSSLFLSISFIAFLDMTIPITPRKKPKSGTKIERIPTIKLIVELLLIYFFSIHLPPFLIISLRIIKELVSYLSSLIEVHLIRWNTRFAWYITNVDQL